MYPTNRLKQYLRINDMANKNFVLPAEWEPQQGIQLTWPHAQTDWKPYLDDITKTFIDMAKVITLDEKLFIVTPEAAHVKRLLAEHLNDEQRANIRYFEMPTNDTWARDHGAITLSNGAELRMLDFKFNGWGEKFDWQKDNAITANMAQMGAFEGMIEDHTDFVLEGGSIESDGKGTIFTTACCLLAPHRNQPMTRKEIEERLLKSLHAQRIIWIEHGQLKGDDTDGHIDTTVRLAPNDTLLYIYSDEDDEHFADFKAMEDQLKSLRTCDGKPYQLLRLPFPKAIYEGEERLPATYANFVILNHHVLCPTYAQPERDHLAMQQLQKAFPNHKIIGIDARTVIRQHGSLHCLTMQYPKYEKA